MKKITIIFIALVFLCFVFFASCTENQKPTIERCKRCEEPPFPIAVLEINERAVELYFVWSIRPPDSLPEHPSFGVRNLYGHSRYCTLLAEREYEAEDFFLRIGTSDWLWTENTLHIVPTDGIYQIERQSISTSGSPDFAWHFRGYSTDENLLEAQILSFYFKHRDKTPKVMAKIAPFIEKWTDFYNIDLVQAEFAGIRKMMRSLSGKYYVELDKNVEKRGVYSPNRQFYTAVREHYQFVFVEKSDEVELLKVGYLFYVFDNERECKVTAIDISQFSEAKIEAAFWLSDNVLVVVGRDYHIEFDWSSTLHHYIWIFDMEKQTETVYRIATRIENEHFGTFRGEGYLRGGRISRVW